MASSSSSSSSSSACRLHPQWRYLYDVFVTFYGKDVRYNFLSHLFAAFRRESVKAFSDERLTRGKKIMPTLLKAIAGSKISVIIFSERYAFSEWPMKELVRIMECQKEYQNVIPVFYKVPPSDVRSQEGSFGQAFVKHEKNLVPETELDIWKAVLAEASYLPGWDSEGTRPDAALVQAIVNDIVKNLESIADRMVKELEPLFGSLRDRLDSLADSFWNKIELKDLYCKVKKVHELLLNAESYRSYRYWLLCPLFTDLRDLTFDVYLLIDDKPNSERQFNRAVKQINERLLRFLDAVKNLVASHEGKKSPIFQLPLPRTVPASYTYVEDNPTLSLSSRNRRFEEAVFMLEIDDDQGRKKAFNIVSKFRGINSIAFGLEDRKMTIKGHNLDTVAMGAKLRKLCHTDLVYLEPAKMPEEGEQHKEESNNYKANDERDEPESHALAKAKKPSKLPISFLSRMCISIK